MTVSRTDEILMQVKWPPLTEAVPLLSEGDALVVCAGFEDRSLAFFSAAVEAGSKGFRLVGLDYRPEVPENRIEKLKELANRASALATVIRYERQEPESSGCILGPIRDAGRILLDVSGMSRLLIVQLLAAAVREGLLERMQVIYTEAMTYPPSKEEVDERLAANDDYLGVLHFISSGVLGITIVPELSTVAMQGQPIRLVSFPSFNPAQFAAVCAEIQASSFSIVNGVPPSAENSWRREAIRKLNNIDSIIEKDEHDVSTLDYRDTLALILELYKRHSATEKIVISPTGSKMQSVAVGLACGFLKDIQVVYPTPRSFPTPSSYTTGVARTYVLGLAAFAAVVLTS